MNHFGDTLAVEKLTDLRVSNGMITVGNIKNGSNYLSRHLRKNDYWTEGEKEVRGEWIGEGAKRLGLEGVVDEKPFDALRRNRHPETGSRLTAREYKNRLALIDIQLSAPKDVSVLAMVGGDERVREAFIASVKTALVELERFAAVRERRGQSAGSEDYRLTDNFVGALFIHDTSRDLDPQLHAHAVLANATWDAKRGEWLALQQTEMLRASVYVRQVLYREIAARLYSLGYETHDMNMRGFAIRGIEHLRERFSKRTHEVQKIAEAFEKEKGRKPTKREIEVIVRESRANKLTEISTPEVRASQRAQLNDEETDTLDKVVQSARAQKRVQHTRASHSEVERVLAAALAHIYERNSVARESTVLAAALELHPGFDAWKELRKQLEQHTGVIRSDGEMTLRPIYDEEHSAVVRSQHGRNTHYRLGNVAALPSSLTRGQRIAAVALLESRDFVSILLGDAGTGKTSALSAIEQAHVASGGMRFIPLAPTTRARDALAASGFPDAGTVQRFLAGDELQKQAAGRVLLVDEAGLLSTHQLDQLSRIASGIRARLLFVGDTKQHYSVERGDALRNLAKHAGLPVVRLSEVLRQRKETDRRFAHLLASGEVVEAFQYAERRGMIHDGLPDDVLFVRAAEHYVENRKRGIDTLVVIPRWDEIDRFHEQVRPALRSAGLLGDAEVTRRSLRPLTWTDEQKVHWSQYREGDHVLFVRATRFFKRGAAAHVVEILKDGLRVRGEDGRVAKITQKQRGAFDVARQQMLAVSVGERILLRGRDEAQGFQNGDFKEVASVDVTTNRITFTDGRELPPDFTAWTYGHALTSYRAQGSSAEESLLVLGEVSANTIARRQFYVGNTRFRGAHTIYVSSRAELLRQLGRPDTGRDLATEFIQRQRISLSEKFAPRYIQRMGARMRNAWLGILHRANRERSERVAHDL